MRLKDGSVTYGQWDKDRDKLIRIYHNHGFNGGLHNLLFRNDERWLRFGSAMGFLDNPLILDIEKLFSSYTGKRKVTLSRFLSAERTIESLENEVLTSSNLMAQRGNDSKEVSEFFNQINVTNFNGGYGLFDNIDHEIKKLKEEYHVLCFTKSSKEQRFWKEYVNNRGCCLKFEVQYNEPEPNFFLRYAEVLYNPIEMYRKVRDIQEDIVKEFNKPLLIPGITHYSLFCKRASYSWEDEVRIAFNYKKKKCILNEKEVDGNVIKYVEFPIGEKHNTLGFTFKLLDIEYGKDIDSLQKEEIHEHFKRIKAKG